MSIVDYGHRIDRVPSDLESYSSSLAGIREHLQLVGWVRGLLVCGSYVKANLAPGWSDLDLVAFYEEPLDSGRLEQGALHGEGKPNPTVPVGIDFVNIDQFRRTRRLGGRPLAMTFELQRYALTSFGPHLIDSVEKRPQDDGAIAIESAFHVRSDANSWVRRSQRGYRSEQERLFDAAKTLLRIAMFESSPYEKTSFTVESYCDSVLGNTRNRSLHLAFSTALGLRRNWARLNIDPEQVSEATAILSSALLWYYESWEPLP